MAFIMPVKAESNPVVVVVEVEGNAHVPTEKILGVISKTRMGEPLDSRSVQTDMQAIMGIGYFTDVRVSTEKMLDGVKLIFEVVENPIFQEVQITGLTKVDLEELKPFFSQKPGEIFNRVTFREDLSKAIKYCQEKKGLYIEPKNLGANGISPDGIVKVELVELKFGKIKILGLVKTQEYVIRRELTIKEGEIIDGNLLREDYYKLMRLRLFDGLDIRFEKSENPDSMDLILEAKEARTGTFSFGFSYSERTQEFGGLLGFTESNLMGTGQNLALDVNISETSRNVQFSFFEPWLDENHTSFGLSMWNADSSITSKMNRWILDPNAKYDPSNAASPADPANPNYASLPTYYNSLYDMDLVKTGLSLSFGRNLWKDVTGRVYLSFEKNQIEDFLPDNSSDSIASNNPVFNHELLDFWDNSARLQLDKNKLIYQDSNFVTGGYELTGNYTVAGKYLGGAFDYSKTVLEGKWFHGITSDLVFGTRLQGGLINGDYPDYDALYLGGMYRLRGYDDRRYRDKTTAELIGTQYLLSNTELRYRFSGNKNVEVVLFYDVGGINNGVDSSNVIKSDYGIGLRYMIPYLGVIRLDQAWNRDGDQRLVFSLGEIF